MNKNIENPDKNLVLIATIIDAHGIKGEVKLKAFTDNKKDIFSFKDIFASNCIDKYKITKKSLTEKSIIASIEGCNSRNDAEKLIGTNLYVKRDDLPEIDLESEVYYHDLINMRVLNQDRTEIAIVKAVYNFGAGDLIEIQYLSNNELDIIPFNKQVVINIDLVERYIIVDLPELI